jgi:hypothetical protein
MWSGAFSQPQYVPISLGKGIGEGLGLSSIHNILGHSGKGGVNSGALLGR